MKRIIRNLAQCRKCGEVVESEHRHDSKSCRCGAIAVDGGKDYLRRSARDLRDVVELSVTEEEGDNGGREGP